MLEGGDRHPEKRGGKKRGRGSLKKKGVRLKKRGCGGSVQEKNRGPGGPQNDKKEGQGGG